MLQQWQLLQLDASQKKQLISRKWWEKSQRGCAQDGSFSPGTVQSSPSDLRGARITSCHLLAM